MGWLAESINDVSSPYDKARFEAGYAVVKDPPRCPCGHKIADHSGNYSGSRACDHCTCPAYPNLT